MTVTSAVDLNAVVERLLDDAGSIALAHFRTRLVPDDKGGMAGYDPVTEADLAIEDLLRDGLHERFPDHEIVGEERGVTGTPGRYRWLIDPIDGTKAFITGSPLWGILLGLLDDRRPVAGWMHQPYLEETFGAVDGDAWCERRGDRTALATRRGVELSDAILSATFPGMFGTPGEAADFERLSQAVRLVRFGGDCYSYCLLAMGHLDLVVEASLQAYDIVPLIPIVEAAGGVVTDRHGDVPIDGGFVVAAGSAELHAQALEIINYEEPV